LPGVDDDWRRAACNAMDAQSNAWRRAVVLWQDDTEQIIRMFDAAIASEKPVHEHLIDAVHHFLSGLIKPLFEVSKRKPSNEVGKLKAE